MRAQIKRILSDVAKDSAEWAKKHKKALGGVGAAGAFGALGGEPTMDMARRGIGLGRRVADFGEAVEKAEGGYALDKPPSVHPETLRYKP